MLETRLQARSAPLPISTGEPGDRPGFTQEGDFLDPARSLLGESQEAWLRGRLRTSRANWKFLGQQVMFAQLKAVAVAAQQKRAIVIGCDSMLALDGEVLGKPESDDQAIERATIEWPMLNSPNPGSAATGPMLR